MTRRTNTARKIESIAEAAPPATALAAADAAFVMASESPALELQRRLGEAALRGFYAPVRNSRGVNVRRICGIVVVSAASWALVFGIGFAALR